jgi:O-antigen ligase
MFSMGVLNFARGFRSLGGICVATALYALVQQFTRESSRFVRISAIRVLAVFVIGMAVSVAIVQAYTYAAARGHFGVTEQEKLREESGDFGVLVGGRSEVFISATAIAESPILGHGSWAIGPTNDQAIEKLRNLGYSYIANVAASADPVPSHSFILGAWVEAGILGALFWGWVLVTCVRVLLRLHRFPEAVGALIAFTSLSLLWDVLFSPYGAEGRLSATYYVVVLLFALRHMSVGGDERQEVAISSRQRELH